MPFPFYKKRLPDAFHKYSHVKKSAGTILVPRLFSNFKKDFPENTTTRHACVRHEQNNLQYAAVYNYYLNASMRPLNNANLTVPANERACFSCGKPLKGRSDKKFCDDYCRNNYNNQQKGPDNRIIRNISNAIKKNRHILLSLLHGHEETTKTTREKLLNLGFSFKYFTHQYVTQRGNTYFYCYDHGYLSLDNNWILIVADKDSLIETKSL